LNSSHRSAKKKKQQLNPELAPVKRKSLEPTLKPIEKESEKNGDN